MEEFIMYNNDKEFNYTDILDEDNDYYFDDEVECLKEDAGAAGLRSIIGTLFCHILKFIYQPTRQSRSWVDSIKNSYVDIMTIIYSKKTRGEARKEINKPDFMDKAFSTGLNKFNHDTHMGLNISRPYNWDINFVQDKEAIKSILYEKANSDKIVEYIDEAFRRVEE
jgi:hypothetical protein